MFFIKNILIIALLFALEVNANEPRVALVIGNNDYTYVTKLKNAVNDARLIKKNLEKKGFLVFYKENATKKDIEKLVNKFSKKIDQGGVALVYYAGHGAQVNGRNYLIPIDGKLNKENEFKYSSVSLDKMIYKIENTKNRINILILDACRNNPFNSFSQKGLAPVSSSQDIFIAYSAQANSTASDGKEKDVNSPYTLSLVKYMSYEGLPLEEVFKKTRKDVYQLTNGNQRPVEYSQIFGDFYFTPESSTTRSLKRSKNNEPKFKKHKRYIEPEMVKIPAGSFTMGSDEGDESFPEHKVNVENDFYISKYEITFKEYDLFCKSQKRDIPSDNNWGRDNQPVINVTWHDAKAYASWLSKKTGKQYRLPSEAEWEYSLRANSTTLYHFSDNENMLGKYAWYDENTQRHPYPVGLKEANAFGIHDMIGNVREWTEDSFWPYRAKQRSSKAHTRLSDTKVVRGGNWYSEYDVLVSYKREDLDSNEKDDSTGFRLVLE